MLEIRKLQEHERETSYRLSQYSFGFWSDGDLSEDELGTINLDNALGGFVEDELVAKVTNWPFQQCVRGVLKPSAGLAGVATVPLHRRKGYIRQLLKATFEAMCDEGQVVSSLYPFLESFYAKFGYVTSNDYMWLKFQTRYLSQYLAFTEHSDEWELVLNPAKDAQSELVAYSKKIAPSYHGFVIQANISPYVWRKYVAKDQWILFLKHRGETVGAVRYKIEGNMNDGKLTVYNIFWESLGARDRLFGYFAMHEVNLPETVMALPLGTPFQNWFYDPTDDFTVTVPYIAMMCRVIDPIGAVAGLPAGVNGRFRFQYSDEQCPWTDGTYEMVAENGRLHLQKTGRTTENSVNPKGLSALVFGTCSVEEMIHRGWSSLLPKDAVTLLHHWFPPQMTFNPNRF